MDPVFVKGAQEFEGKTHAFLVLRLDLLSHDWICKCHPGDHGRVFCRPAGNSLYHTVPGDVNIPSIVKNTGCNLLFFDIDSNSRCIDQVNINLVNERNVRHSPVMVFESHNKGIVSQSSSGDKGFNLFLAVLGISINHGFLQVEDHEDHRKCNGCQSQKAEQTSSQCYFPEQVKKPL